MAIKIAVFGYKNVQLICPISVKVLIKIRKEIA